MRIYIDESGNFIPGSQASRVCCVAALVIPEVVARTLMSEFEALRATWTDEAELKGNSLTDDQTTQALSLIGKFDVLAHIIAVDASVQTPEQAKQFQTGQGQGFVNTTPNYYAQRLPTELGKFDWVIDPKDIKPTRYEEIWQKIVCPVLQTMSLEKPIPRIEEFDYSAFTRFDMPIPKYIKPHLPNASSEGRDGKGLNLGMLMRESVSFPDSKDSSGLQLVDIVAAAFTKAMNGKLPPPVWRLLGSLMVEAPHLGPTARLIALGDGPRHLVGEYHTYVLKAIRNRAKKMFVAR